MSECSTVVLKIDDTTDISCVGRLHAQLLETMSGHGRVEIDAQRATRTDTAVLQLLAAACEEARGRQIAIELENPTPALREAASLLGLAHTLGLDPDSGTGEEDLA